MVVLKCMDDKSLMLGPSRDFESIKQANEAGIEYWLARDLMSVLGYEEWRKFEGVIEKAKEACKKSGQYIISHFVGAAKNVNLGSVGSRKVTDYKLSRYACYLIAQNGDTRKPKIALAQTYFAVQTRKQELFEQSDADRKRVFVRDEVTIRNKQLFSTAKKAGVNNFGLFNDAGYKGLYGGMTSIEIEQKKGLKKGELLDRAGAAELAANLFRITQTDEKINKENIKGDFEARQTHFMVGGEVRQAIKKIGGVMPEKLPPEKHIKLLKKELKKLT